LQQAAAPRRWPGARRGAARRHAWLCRPAILRPPAPTARLLARRRDKELAKFEAFLNKEECMNISALVRGRSRMAYPIKG
jgi:hypothetical protein